MLLLLVLLLFLLHHFYKIVKLIYMNSKGFLVLLHNYPSIKLWFINSKKSSLIDLYIMKGLVLCRRHILCVMPTAMLFLVLMYLHVILFVGGCY